jgi:ribosomal protein S18 acetylase RimI-like enzyme
LTNSRIPSQSIAGFSVRRALERDLPELKRMRAELQELLWRIDRRVWRLSSEFLLNLDRFYADVIAKDTNRIFVAGDAQDRPVGMAMVRIIDSPQLDPRPFGRIDDAWVEPEWRGRGVMTALTRAACNFLVERNVPLVMLDWANLNEPSGTCWQRIGFQPVMTMGFTSPKAILEQKE